MYLIRILFLPLLPLLLPRPLVPATISRTLFFSRSVWEASRHMSARLSSGPPADRRGVAPLVRVRV